MAEDLSPADRSSLAAQQGPVSMGRGGVLVFEAEIGHERLIERIGARLHLVPRYRQRLQHAASGITNPVWVDDDHFDIGGTCASRACRRRAATTSSPSWWAPRCRGAWT